MAKSTSTTKAKTKTAAKKKPTTKAAAAKAKSTTKKVAPKKTVAKKAAPKSAATKAKAPAKTSTGRLAFLSRTQARLGILYALLAVAAGFLMKSDSAQVLLGHLSKDELASRSGTVLAPAAHALYEVEFRWLLVALLGIAAVVALLRATKYAAAEEAGVKNRVQPLRWIEVAITGALLFEVAALLNGVQDLIALKVGMISIALAAYFGWIYERENAANGKPARTVLIASQITAIIPVVALLVTAVATYVYGIARSPWYAYAALALFVFSAVAIPRSLNKLTAIGKDGYSTFDKALNIRSAVVKVAIAAILIIGLYAQ